MTHPAIALYPVTITQANRMAETGTQYTPLQWGTNTREYQGEQGEPDRVLILADGVEIYRTIYDQIAFSLDGRVLLDTEIIDRNGRMLDASFGETRKREPGEPVADLTELVPSLDNEPHA
jgi:hypothetical protein